MAVVALVVFGLLRLTPGDPAAVIAGDYASPQDVAKIRASLGLDRPLHVQLGLWFGNLLRGDLGTSIFSGLPVTTLIRQRVEPTVALATLSMIVAIAIAVPLGVLAAWKQGSWIDRTVMVFAVSGFSMPVFWLGFLLVWVFALQLGWLPVQGYSPLSRGLWPFLRQLILPALTLGFVYMALITRMTRASMLTVLREDYIRTAYAKGPAPGRRAAPACAQERGAARAHHHRRRGGDTDRRRGGDGERVRAAGDRPAHGGRHPAPRLPGDPGRDPDSLGRLRAHQPRHRPALSRARSTDPVLMSTAGADLVLDVPVPRGRAHAARVLVTRNPTLAAGCVVLLLLALSALAAPLWTATDAQQMNPSVRLRPPDAEHPFGTDHFGRDVFARTLYGGRISLRVGLIVALLALSAGTAVGLVSGYYRALDTVVMRVVDGLMAIPSILLALALMALVRASVETVIVALVVPEIPRVVRVA